MKINYPKIKRVLHIIIFSIDLLIFLIVLFSTNSSSEKYKEYTDSSKFFLDLYIIAIYAVLIVITIFPKLLYYKIKKYILFIFSDKGKVIISLAISLIYWFAKNNPQFVLGFILTITSLVLIIYEFIFYFTKVETFLSNKGIEFENKNQPTIDLNDLDKAEQNNATPMSNANKNQYNPNSGNQNYENGNANKDGNNKEANSGNNNPIEQRDVEISSGYDNSQGGQQGFGF